MITQRSVLRILSGLSAGLLVWIGMATPALPGPARNSGTATQAKEKEVAPKKIAIRAGRLIDAKSDAPIANALILVEGDKIVSVTAGGTPPAGVEIIDLSKATVLPGFIDVHTHVMLNGDITAEDYDAQLLKESIPYRAILGGPQRANRARPWVHNHARFGNGRRDVRRR